MRLEKIPTGVKITPPALRLSHRRSRLVLRSPGLDDEEAAMEKKYEEILEESDVSQLSRAQ